MAAEDGLLLTDLYELSMLAAYHDEAMIDTAVFELFVRDLPPGRNFLLAAGLESVLDFLAAAHFSAEELDWLAATGRFRQDFVDHLAGWRFTGAVHAMAEGTVFFADEPILRVVAPMPEAQLIETRVINLLHYQTLVASKAARSVLAAPGRLLVDFGLRRAHGAEAGMLAARASYLAGFAGTSNVAAGRRWGIPLYGTMAHSYVQAHEREVAAFEAFARVHPKASTLLIDTYDTEAAAAKLPALAQRLGRDGIAIQAVRLDSGDLGEHARRVRRILDASGLAEVKIFASGNLDEWSLQKLARRATIDGYGVGTRMTTAADQPYLDCAYKLVQYGGRPTRKRSEGKATWPGPKQVYRVRTAAGELSHDDLTLADEGADGEALLQPVMAAGRRLAPAPDLAAVRARAADQLAGLPAALRVLAGAEPYAVRVSPGLRELAARIDRAPV
jgi:nicotinate phosphoribosyltransferase